MYAANICKACLRASHRSRAAVFFTAPRGFGGLAAPAVGSPERNKRFVTRLPSFAVRGSSYCTAAKTPDPAPEDPLASEKSFVESPSEELMRSLGEKDQRALKSLWMEAEVLFEEGHAVPTSMSDAEWCEAMEKPNRSQRQKYLRYLAVTQSRIEHRRIKRAKAAEDLEVLRAVREQQRAADPEAFEMQYSLNKNTLFLRLYKSTMNQAYNARQCQALLFGQSIVVDLGYDEHMARFETINCAKQIKDLYGFNKMNRQPFHLHFCNATPDNTLLQYVERAIPNLYEDSCFITVTEKSYVDVFPRRNLVYLTPHCKHDIEEYDHDAVYIIGGIVDKTVQLPISLAKAKRDGIAMGRLPIDRYLDWGLGNKSLTLDQVMKIMLDAKNTQCWQTALKHVPRRKLKEEDSRNDPFAGIRFRRKRNF